MVELESPDVQSPQMRRAGKDLLSLALMDARNHTLRWIGVFEEALAARRFAVPLQPDLNPPLWLLGHVGWFQERWVVRNVHRQRGVQADASAPRLASVIPEADRWYDPTQAPHAARWRLELPDLQGTKQYLADTMDITLDLLDGAGEGDDALYFFRLALFHEDLRGESFAEMAQALGIGVPAGAGLLREVPAAPSRAPLLFPATRWPLGSMRGGFVFDNEKWAHDVEVPEFEIDAQPVSWAQYAEFVEDGGYDEPQWWSADGLAWLGRQQRRAPRYVDQVRHGILQRRFGRVTRLAPSQPVLHVTRHEAEAWCCWSGRRLPAEVEWEAAAQAYARGFTWGGAWEWTASSFRPFPDFQADPWHDYSQPHFGRSKVLRGASPATRLRLRHPKFRRFESADRDDCFAGFRSCAL